MGPATDRQVLKNKGDFPRHRILAAAIWGSVSHIMAQRICILGLGYIGLPLAAVLARHDLQIIGVDINQQAVQTINQGRIHIYEPGLEEMVRTAVSSGRLRAYEKPQTADTYLICVPTPFHAGTVIPQANIDYVLAAARSIAPLVKAGDVIILESTSPVGTTERVAEVLAEAGAEVAALHIAYCPERVLPGRIIEELTSNNRIVGGLNKAAARAAADFYRIFVTGEVVETDARTAEMCKLAENSFRDLNIAYANELSMICDRQGIDVWNLIALANKHPRVNILQPGPGVGGHCIAVDPWFIVASAPDLSPLIRTGREVNNRKAHWVVEKIVARAEVLARELGRPPRLSCYGLAFKPDIDDLRESPALEIAGDLARRGYEVLAVEPNITSHGDFRLLGVDEALQQGDLHLILVKHRPFAEAAVKKRLREAGAMDFCGLFAS